MRKTGQEKRAYMAQVREIRRSNGYREVNVWVPVEDKEKIHKLAKEVRQSCERPFDNREKTDV